MPQLILTDLTSTDSHFTLSGQQAHHALRVLRLKVGDTFVITNGSGLRWSGLLTHVSDDLLQAQGQLTLLDSSLTPTRKIHLYQGLIRGSKFDFVLEKATELGVTSMTPFLSEKNPIRLDDSDRVKKTLRWTALVQAAIKQCGSANIPTVNPVVDFPQLLDILKGKIVYLLDPSTDSSSLSLVLKGRMPAGDVSLVVGPESGLSTKEVDLLKQVGCQSIGLGKRILRAETAGLVMLSILNYEGENF